MDRQTLRDWVHRDNVEGLAGLSDRKAPGPAPRLSTRQQAEVAALVRAGPDLEEHGIVRWRRSDLSQVISRYARLARAGGNGLLGPSILRGCYATCIYRCWFRRCGSVGELIEQGDGYIDVIEHLAALGKAQIDGMTALVRS